MLNFLPVEMNNFFEDMLYSCTLNFYKVFDSILEKLVNWQIYDFLDKRVIFLLKKIVLSVELFLWR